MTRDKGIRIKNIYYMLAYAFTALGQGGYEDVAAEGFANMHDLFAAILAKGIGRLLKQGLYREYAPQQEELTTLRGKLDMPGTMRCRPARKRTLCCSYDGLSGDALPNRILKTTALLLLKHARVSQAHKDGLKRVLLLFANVGTIGPGAIRGRPSAFAGTTPPTACSSASASASSRDADDDGGRGIPPGLIF